MFQLPSSHFEMSVVFTPICELSERVSFPAWGAGNKAPLLLFPGLAAVEHGRRSLFLCTVLNSFVFDYVTRQKFSGGSLNKYVLIQLPVVNPPSGPCPWNPDLLLDEWILNRALELSATGNDLTSLSNELSRGHQIFRHDAARRFLLQCELDAAYFHLYGIQKCDSDYILETFPIFRRNDEAAYGEYRTKRVILEIYERHGRSRARWRPLRNPPRPAARRPARRALTEYGRFGTCSEEFRSQWSLLSGLTSPENLYWAWGKVRRYYRTTDAWFNEAELAAFESKLETELGKLREQFRSKTYGTSPLLPLPQPKALDNEGKPRARQAFWVSVADQVAWIAVANVIGPAVGSGDACLELRKSPL